MDKQLVGRSQALHMVQPKQLGGAIAIWHMLYDSVTRCVDLCHVVDCSLTSLAAKDVTG
jgi:hypothetical protein